MADIDKLKSRPRSVPHNRPRPFRPEHYPHQPSPLALAPAPPSTGLGLRQATLCPDKMNAEQPTSQRVSLGRWSAAAICGRYHEVAVGGSINYKRDFVGTGLHLRGRSRSQLGAASLLHQSSQHHAGTTRTYPSRVFKAEPGRADKPFRPSRARRARRTAVMLASRLNLTKPGGSPP
jgi:hypothetical protein